MPEYSAWDMLSKKAKKVFVTLGTRDQKEINRLSDSDLTDTDRESRMFGYKNNGPYDMLQHEQERRKSARNRFLGLVTVVIAIIGLYFAVFKA